MQRIAAALLADLSQAVRTIRKTTTDIASSVHRLDERLDKQSDRLSAVKRELDALRGDVSDRLLRINLQLGAMTRLVQHDARPGGDTQDKAGTGRLSGRVIPPTVEIEEPQWAPVTGGEVHPDPSGTEWLLVDSCPFCRHRERTVVVEWNKLIMLAKGPDQQSASYNYSCCHRCGVVYAARRPIGKRFLFLLEHFGEVTGKAAADGIIPNPMLNPYPLSDADKERLRQMAARGVWISDHLGLRNNDYVEGALRDRFANSVHVDVIASLVRPTGARVLEIRPRAGTIAESLRRLFQADVAVMPMWESQKLLLKELYGFDAEGLIDYDHFHIPFAGRFDLIVCNHIMVHAVRPAELLGELRAHLNPGGHVYFYNEPEDREVLEKGQSIIAHLNPLHMQTFDQAAMIRALAANGLDVTFIKSRDCSFMVLARAAEGPVAWSPIAADALERRIEAYRLARDRAILKMPPDMRPRLGHHWTAAIEHGLAAGAVAFDAQGQLRFSAD